MIALLTNKSGNEKGQLRMTAENTLRIARQYSDEALRVRPELFDRTILFSIENVFLCAHPQTVNENARLEAIRAASERAWMALLRAVQAVKRAANELPTAPEVVDHLRSLLRDESKIVCCFWFVVEYSLITCGGIFVHMPVCRNNVFYVCIGIGVGTVGGFMLGAYWSRPLAPPVMKAIACTHLDGPNVSGFFLWFAW